MIWDEGKALKQQKSNPCSLPKSPRDLESSSELWKVLHQIQQLTLLAVMKPLQVPACHLRLAARKTPCKHREDSEEGNTNAEKEAARQTQNNERVRAALPFSSNYQLQHSAHFWDIPKTDPSHHRSVFQAANWELIFTGSMTDITVILKGQLIISHWWLTFQAGLLSLHTRQQTHREQKHYTCTRSQEVPLSPLLPTSGFTCYRSHLCVFSHMCAIRTIHPPFPPAALSRCPVSLATWVRNAFSMLHHTRASQQNYGNELYQLHYRVPVALFSFVSLHEVISRVTSPLIPAWKECYKDESTAPEKLLTSAHGNFKPSKWFLYKAPKQCLLWHSYGKVFKNALNKTKNPNKCSGY